MYKIAFTGHRPQKLAAPASVKARIRKFLVDQQSMHGDLLVISGGALGVDQFAAEVCIALDIPFVFILPFPIQVMSARWPSSSRQHLQSLQSHAVKSYVTQSKFSMSGYQRRNEVMVDHADLLCAVYNGTSGGTANCIRYAQSISRNIYYIRP